MKAINRLLLVLLTLIVLPSWGNSPVLLPDGSYDIPVTQYVAIYEDSSARLGIERMLTREQQLRFTPSHSQTLKFGVSDSVFWLRLSITNPYNNERQAVISLSNNRLGQVRLFDITSGDLRSVLAAQQAGQLRGGFQQAYPFRVALQPKSTHSYLIRLSSDSVFNSAVYITSLDHFLLNEQAQFWTLGLVLGWILATLAYFAQLWVGQRLALAGWSVGYCLSMAGYLVAWSSLGAALHPVPPEVREWLTLVCLPLAAIAFNQAVNSLPWPTPVRRIGLTVLSLLQAVTMLTALFLDGFADLLVTLAVTINYLLLAVWLLFRHSHKRKAQQPLQWGAAIAGLGLLISVLTDLNLLQLDTFTDWATLLLPMVMVVSLVLASMRINRTHKSYQSRANLSELPPALLAQISHELRSPINGVIGMSELLSDSPLSTSQRSYLDTIHMAGRDLVHVTNQLADLGRLYEQRIELESRAFAINELLEHTMTYFQQQSVQKQVELMLDASDRLAPRYIGDQQRIAAILYSLLRHTLDYAEFGELTLRAQPYQHEQQQGLHLQLVLSGSLIKHEEFRAVLRQLQPQRGHDSDLANRHWDLRVSRQLLAHMHARMAVESINQQGASVDLYLPLTAEHDAAERAMFSDPRLIGRRVLIVDDNATLRTVLEKHLKRWNIDAWVSHSGPEALAQLRSQASIGEPIDTVITDQDMPAMTGLQLAERINGDKEIEPKPRMMMLTGMVSAELRRKALNVGIRQVIPKPITADKLRRCLNELETSTDPL
ncbi:hypothetical protein CHH28_09690 [Bacterioplanes sanyensis]|uniref:histidine kinase n=1 Tax=Bacterioplanes sanyensis TaxID=1249553 RepID=A0A222FK28_9GAMM|nr:7TM-DISM domain-containing protein [Bacterioplanes sanyensis]ASP38936.1 hypothetical protein CHH28_09690 [Bacterioplanes sanyensis]